MLCFFMRVLGEYVLHCVAIFGFANSKPVSRDTCPPDQIFRPQTGNDGGVGTIADEQGAVFAAALDDVLRNVVRSHCCRGNNVLRQV